MHIIHLECTRPRISILLKNARPAQYFEVVPLFLESCDGLRSIRICSVIRIKHVFDGILASVVTSEVRRTRTVDSERDGSPRNPREAEKTAHNVIVRFLLDNTGKLLPSLRHAEPNIKCPQTSVRAGFHHPGQLSRDHVGPSVNPSLAWSLGAIHRSVGRPACLPARHLH